MAFRTVWLAMALTFLAAAQTMPGRHCINYKEESEALIKATSIIVSSSQKSPIAVFLTNALPVLQAMASNTLSYENRTQRWYHQLLAHVVGKIRLRSIYTKIVKGMTRKDLQLDKLRRNFIGNYIVMWRTSIVQTISYLWLAWSGNSEREEEAYMLNNTTVYSML